MDQYSIICQWSDEDEGYIAIVPELKGLSAFGETASEAIKELEVAKELYLKVFEEDGCDIPDPKKLPEFSGQLRIRLPKSLHAELSRDAEREGVSLNTYIVSLLSHRNRTAKLQRDINVIKNCFYNTVATGELQKYAAGTGPSTVGSVININERKMA
ncbi:toxin-antitoxin system HicB family antitoxin [uncultured Desulfosarcina sp.]|uniref:type II toxin-antitoxin system HicB family antitoxin n=1 Tax=uncultured Desulfosarcina sp. TaxID=218289 RepID=UPI0029C9576A|nr:toxin-antitoxin system HicB family antitoxin [uncultured Desulfosarcina sp.]